jgi:teichuronic acid biosynthesis glycosyltransferase TuaG
MTSGTPAPGDQAPLVSAVLPVYNGERFLAATLESLLAQTYPALEVIAVDDGSTDGSRAILEGYKERFGGRLTILAIPNSGVSRARNAGVEAAKGLYVAFIDQDDLWAPEKVARQVAALTRSRSRVSFTNMAVIDAAGRVRSSRVCRFPAGEAVDWFGTVLFDPMVGISSVMMERALFLEAGGFPAGLRLAEDYALLLEVLSRERPAVVDEDLLRYREHPGSGTFTRTDALVTETLGVLAAWREKRPEVFRNNRARHAAFRLRLRFLRLKAGMGR